MSGDTMWIIKIGGGREINLAGLADDLRELRQPYLIVHGGNALRDELAARLGFEKRVLTSPGGVDSVYSDEQAIDLLLLAYAGLRNKRLVELLQVRGIPAIGLCGLDGRVVSGLRNTGTRARENGKTRIVRDYSGKPRSCNRALLQGLLALGLVPVLTVPIADETGRAINADNDDVVALLKTELGASTVIQFIEAAGLLADPADPGSRVARIARNDLPRWEDRSRGRFRRKIIALRKLLADGPGRVLIADGRLAHPLQAALAGQGTLIETEE